MISNGWVVGMCDDRENQGEMHRQYKIILCSEHYVRIVSVSRVTASHKTSEISHAFRELKQHIH